LYLLNKTLKFTKTLTASFITKRKTNNTDNKGRHQTRDRTDEHKIHIENLETFKAKQNKRKKRNSISRKSKDAHIANIGRKKET
jgi:ribosomal protein L24